MADRLDVYEDRAGEWRWRRVAEGNNEPISASNEWFATEYNARRAAERANPDFALYPLLAEADRLLTRVQKLGTNSLPDDLVDAIDELIPQLRAAPR